MKRQSCDHIQKPVNWFAKKKRDSNAGLVKFTKFLITCFFIEHGGCLWLLSLSYHQRKVQYLTIEQWVESFKIRSAVVSNNIAVVFKCKVVRNFSFMKNFAYILNRRSLTLSVSDDSENVHATVATKRKRFYCGIQRKSSSKR